MSHFGDETYARLDPNLYSNFDDFVACLDRCTLAVDAWELGWSMALPVDLLAVKEAVKPQWFATGATRAHGRREELDSPWRESLHVQDIQAFSEPVDH